MRSRWSDEDILFRLRNRELHDQQEAQEIHKEIEGMEKLLSEVPSSNTERKKYTAYLGALFRRYDSVDEYVALQKHLAYLRALFAPIRRLPAEVLAEIYQNVLVSARNAFIKAKEAFHLTELGPSDPIGALLTLTSVCFFWRITCISTATLWSDICLPSLVGKNPHLATMHLQYSANAPLSILIHNSRSDSSSGTSKAIMAGLVSHRDRWRSISLLRYPTSKNLIEVLGQCENLEFPSLEALALSFDIDEVLGGIFSPAALPCLRTLEVHGFHPGVFPLEQLTSLALTLSDADRLPRDLAKHFRNLKNLRIHGILSHIPGEAPTVSELPYLHSLEVGFDDETSLGLFFTALNLPVLSLLNIASWEDSWPQAELTSMLDSSKCSLNLTRLFLKCVPITDKELLQLLRYLPNLDEFRFEERRGRHLSPTLTPTIFEAMTFGLTDDDVACSPQLQTLDLTMSVHNIRRPLGLEMVVSRTVESFSKLGLANLGCRPLKSFTLSLISVGGVQTDMHPSIQDDSAAWQALKKSCLKAEVYL